jgi:hypothetical protein
VADRLFTSRKTAGALQALSVLAGMRPPQIQKENAKTDVTVLRFLSDSSLLQLACFFNLRKIEGTSTRLDEVSLLMTNPDFHLGTSLKGLNHGLGLLNYPDYRNAILWDCTLYRRNLQWRLNEHVGAD